MICVNLFPAWSFGPDSSSQETYDTSENQVNLFPTFISTKPASALLHQYQLIKVSFYLPDEKTYFTSLRSVYLVIFKPISSLLKDDFL